MAAAEAAVRVIPTACGDSDLANEGASRLVTVGQAAIGNQQMAVAFRPRPSPCSISWESPVLGDPEGEKSP